MWSGERPMDDRFVQPDGDKIRQLRQAHFWSQERLADMAGLRKRTVERAEAGARLQRSSLQALAQALGCPPDALVHGARSMARSQDQEPAAFEPGPTLLMKGAPGEASRPITMDSLPSLPPLQATEAVAHATGHSMSDAEWRQLTVLC
jgi:transcriptional regulator with XRE-family HTH domain